MTEEEKIDGMTHNGIKVLMYHKIAADEKLCRSHWTYVSEEQFRKHLTLLDHWGFTPITFEDYLLYRKGEINLPKKSVILTFDDGYEGIYKIAFPMLKEFGWNAVLFVLGDRIVKSDFWDKHSGLPEANLLSGEQIIEMHEAGFEVGSHSMQHANLINIPQKIARYEILQSKEMLQALLKSQVKSFCYPYGLTNNTIKNIVHESGYELACGVYTGPPKFWEDKYDIRRITIKNSTNSFSFGLKMLAPFEYYEWLGSKIKGSIRISSKKLQPQKKYTTATTTDGTYSHA